MTRVVVDIKGHTEPRIYTPPLRELTPETSLGFLAIQFAEDVLDITLLPWQQWLMIHALEMVDTKEGKEPRFKMVVVELARQSGKSTLSQVLSLFCLFMLDANLVVGAAQDVAIAKEIWQGVVQIVQDIPELAEQIDGRPRTTNGQIELALSGYRRYVVKSSNARAGRGVSSDLVILDELREQKDWGGWSALTATTLARPKSQVWALSNAGDATSVVLRHLRVQAHKALGDPDGFVADIDPDALLDEGVGDDGLVSDDSLGWFEWSAAPKRAIDDVVGWQEANPSLGYGFVTMKSLRAQLTNSPPDVFRTEVMCQFVEALLGGAFPAGSWESQAVPAAVAREVGNQIVGDVVAGVGLTWGRSNWSIAYAGRRADGTPQVEVVQAGNDPGDVVGWLTSDRREVRPREVIIQSASPAATLISPLRAAGVRVTEMSGSDVGKAHGRFYDLVVGGTLRHLSDPVLDVIVATAQMRPLTGGTWAWDIKASKGDISPLIAVTNATWGLDAAKPAPLTPVLARPSEAGHRPAPGRRTPPRRGGVTSDLSSMRF